MTGLPVDLAAHLAQQFAARWGASRNAPPPELKAYDTLKEWLDTYRPDIRGEPFDWTKYEHLVELYEDEHPEITVMAGAQTGKSIWLMAHMTRAGILRWGAMIGYYFPDEKLPSNFSKNRLAPFIESSPQLGKWLGRDQNDRKGVNQTLSRSFGASVFLLLSTRSTTGTEGTPMQAVYLDEVRRMEHGDVARVLERTSAQANPSIVLVSTAKYPESDIHAHFLAGDQRYFHTDCSQEPGHEGCADGVVLALNFPACVRKITEDTPAEFLERVERTFTAQGLDPELLGGTPEQRKQYPPAVYVCPTCDGIIANPRRGWWEPHNPTAYAHSYHMPQLLLWTYPASRAISKWEDPRSDPEELYNSFLGLPWINPEAQPVRMSHCLACVHDDLEWAAYLDARRRRAEYPTVAMGVDVQKGYNVVVVKALAPNGKYQTIHIQIAHSDEDHGQWKETARIMRRFRVQACVIDAQPEYSAALSLAKRHEGKVWLAYYTESETAHIVSWGDRPKEGDDAKQGVDRSKYHVSIQRTKGLQRAADRWVNGWNELPPVDALVQDLPLQDGRPMLTPELRVGRMAPYPVARLYLEHQTKVIFEKHYTNDEAKRAGKYRMHATHISVDPHFAHANLYADIALGRVLRPRRSDA